MPDPQKIPGGTEKFRASKVYKNLVAKIPELDQVLKDNGALIAGGSVLGALLDTEYRSNINQWGSDADIYVPIPNDKTIHTLFRQKLTQGYRNFKSSEYCESFLRRNGIRTVVSYGTTDTMYSIHNPNYTAIDVMAIRKRTTPLQVVQNFDLTFCQVWYDGEDVWATHPEHIQNKSGELQGDYVKVFLSGNHFLRKRMRKYMSRGFKIKADTTGVEATQEILNDFGSMPRLGYCMNQYPESREKLARKTLFRASIVEHYTPIREYLKEEDGYDSDEYVDEPEKIIELAGSEEALAELINGYFDDISRTFNQIDFEEYPYRLEHLLESYFGPLVEEATRLCGDVYFERYDEYPSITVQEGNNNATSVGSMGSVENNVQNGNNIPEGENRPIETRAMETPDVTECFDPYMASNVDIADNQVLFYIYKQEPNQEPEFVRAACIDNETEEDGETVLLYKRFLEAKQYVYYKCLPTVPQGAIFIGLHQIEPEPLRRLAFHRNIYVFESQANNIEAGKKYALIPTENRVGRIVSKSLLQTGDAVSAEHCQTNYQDKIYEIYEMVSPAEGGAVKLRKLPKDSKVRRGTFRKKGKNVRKTRNRRSYKNKVRRIRK